MKNNKIEERYAIEGVKLNIKDPYFKVIALFFSFPERCFQLNQIVKLARVSKINANKIVNTLFKQEFITKEIIGKSWQVKCEKSHKFNKTKKIPYNLWLVYESGILEQIKSKIGAYKSIILFGSYRKGDDTENSDLDIAIQSFTESKHEINEFCLIKNLGYRQNVEVSLHIFSNKNINKYLLDNIKNGVTLEGDFDYG